jgi:hypothetical protein
LCNDINEKERKTFSFFISEEGAPHCGETKTLWRPLSISCTDSFPDAVLMNFLSGVSELPASDLSSTDVT